MSTIFDVAKEAGVSPATVSRVINNNMVVSERKRKLVFDAIQKTGYEMPQPKPRSKKGKVVLLLTTTISISLIEEFESVTASAGLGFLVLYLNDKQYPQTELFDVIFSMHKSNLIYGVVFEGLTKELSQETIDLLNHYPSAQLGTDYNLKKQLHCFYQYISSSL